MQVVCGDCNAQKLVVISRLMRLANAIANCDIAAIWWALLVFSDALRQVQLLQVLLTSRPPRTATPVTEIADIPPKESFNYLILYDVEPLVIDRNMLVYLANKPSLCQYCVFSGLGQGLVSKFWMDW